MSGGGDESASIRGRLARGGFYVTSNSFGGETVLARLRMAVRKEPVEAARLYEEYLQLGLVGEARGAFCSGIS
jgi:hypothetical protein